MYILLGNNTIEFSRIPALLRLVLKALQQFEGIFRIKIQCEEYSQQMAFNSTIAQNNTETTSSTLTSTLLILFLNWYAVEEKFLKQPVT